MEQRLNSVKTSNSQPPSLNSFWASLELIRSQSAVPAVWRRSLGDHFEGFKRAFLLSAAEPAKYFPCEKCGCAHEVLSPSQPISSVPSEERAGERRPNLPRFVHQPSTLNPQLP